MTTAEKKQVARLFEKAFLNGSAMVGYYIEDTIIDTNHGNKTYNIRLMERPKTAPLPPRMIYEETVVVNNDVGRDELRLEAYARMFNLVPTALGMAYDQMNRMMTGFPPKQEIHNPGPQSIHEVDTPATHVPPISEGQEVNRCLVVDFDSEREASTRILQCSGIEGRDRTPDNSDDPRQDLTALCFAVGLMVRNVEARGFAKQGEAMQIATNLINNIYIDPDFNGEDTE